MSGGGLAAPGWVVGHHRGGAAALHARAWPEPLVRTVWLLEVDRPALVLGSTQPDGAADQVALAEAGFEVARRRSGGGAVVLEPGAAVWIDVLIPRGDPRWDEDVNRSFTWLGQVWSDVLAASGLAAEVHAGPLVRGAHGDAVCFAGLGPGEVTVAGAKAVGLSQRRTRAGARFQAVAYRRWSPAPLAALRGVEVGALPPVAELPGSVDELHRGFLAALAARTATD